MAAGICAASEGESRKIGAPKNVTRREELAGNVARKRPAPQAD